MATKVECDRCGHQRNQSTMAGDWTTLRIGPTTSGLGAKEIDVCGRCARAARAFMERQPQAMAAAS